jgi:hypothetical protein
MSEWMIQYELKILLRVFDKAVSNCSKAMSLLSSSLILSSMEQLNQLDPTMFVFDTKLNKMPLS